MINKISYTPYIGTCQIKPKSSSPAFTGVQTLTHTNIGSCLEGYIGKVRVRKGSDKSECFLNVFKKYIGENAENYSLKNDNGELVGEINLQIRKMAPNSWSTFEYKEDPSHVFVDELRNYSKPDTPYYKKGLEYIKDVGTRLLQIAQRRSDEAMCCGNIKLISKNESKPYYKNVIGMVEEFPPQQNNFGFKFCLNNPNSMILPLHSKEPLSRLQGGL